MSDGPILRNDKARGNCYEAVLILLLVHPGPLTSEHLKVCHGIATQSRPPHARMGHAWLEEYHGGVWWVRDALYPCNLVTRPTYYRLGKIRETEVVQYSPQEALAHVDTTKRPGPWAPHIMAAAHA